MARAQFSHYVQLLRDSARYSTEFTVPVSFSIEETFDVGEDTGSPVIEDVYVVPFRCKALQKLTVKRQDD